jgi:hypothetical protein
MIRCGRTKEKSSPAETERIFPRRRVYAVRIDDRVRIAGLALGEHLSAAPGRRRWNNRRTARPEVRAT